MRISEATVSALATNSQQRMDVTGPLGKFAIDDLPTGPALLRADPPPDRAGLLPITRVVTLPAVIPFFFLAMFAEEPNGTVAQALSLIPLTAPMSIVMRLAVTDVPAGEVALSLLVLALSVIAVIWLAGRLFRVRILLMGTTPKLRDLPKLFAG